MKAYIPFVSALLLAASIVPSEAPYNYAEATVSREVDARNSTEIRTSTTESRRLTDVRLDAKDHYSGKTLEFSPEEAQTITRDRKHKTLLPNLWRYLKLAVLIV